MGNAIILADAEHAIRTCINHQVPDRSVIHFPIGSTVQIAAHNKWTGAYRVVAHAHSNLILELGGKILKWPRSKTRLSPQEVTERMDLAKIPSKTGPKSPSAR